MSPDVIGRQPQRNRNNNGTVDGERPTTSTCGQAGQGGLGVARPWNHGVAMAAGPPRLGAGGVQGGYVGVGTLPRSDHQQCVERRLPATSLHSLCHSDYAVALWQRAAPSAPMWSARVNENVRPTISADCHGGFDRRTRGRKEMAMKPNCSMPPVKWPSARPDWKTDAGAQRLLLDRPNAYASR